MPTKHLVVIGASSGGIEALRILMAGLAPDFPAPICVVVHLSPHSPGLLDLILGRAGALPVTNARDGERLRQGHVYVAPPDHHLTIEPGIARVTKGPHENRFRPAVDPLFRSAAQVYGPGTIGVLISGNLDDGTAGLWCVKQMGGVAIVQDPGEAQFPSMPQSALDQVAIDHVVPIAAPPALLARLVARSVPPSKEDAVPAHIDIEIKIANAENAVDAGVRQLGDPSSYACPDCHGVLLAVSEAGRIRFRCHTGHAHSAESLLAAMNEGIDRSLWSTIRAMESGLLMSELAERSRARGDAAEAERLCAHSREFRREAQAIKELATLRDTAVKARRIAAIETPKQDPSPSDT